jgi:DNA-binding beta-propeller fold protein YncE
MHIQRSALLSCLASIPLAVLLTGCAMTDVASPTTAATGAALNGNVHGGQQPVVGAHVYLMAANTTGYGAASTSLLLGSSTGFSDSVGGYVTTATDGSFSITGDYACTPGTQVYIYVLGGNPGAGVNSAAGFLAALGQCPTAGTFAASEPYIWVNEVSTVAAAYSIAGWAVDALHVSTDNTTLAQNGIANAFGNAPNLVGISTGSALLATPIGNGIVPQATINSIANVLAACINSTGPTSTPCTTLFANAESAGSTGTVPTDTATAAINIAHNPGSNVATLYALAAPAPAFAPALTSQPADFTIGVVFTGTGASGAGLNGPVSIAIDALGDAWIANSNGNSVSKLSGNGAPQSPSGGFKNSSLVVPVSVAIDGGQDAWVADSFSSNLTEYSYSGAVVSPTGGYTGGGLSSPQSVAIFGNTTVWVANLRGGVGAGSVSEFNTAGVAQSGSTGITTGGINNPIAVAVDATGSVWVGNQGNNSISKLTSAGVPITVSGGYTGGGISNPFTVAIDSSGNAWIANYTGGPSGTGSISELSSTGTALSPATNGWYGGGIESPYSLVIDGGNTIWTANFANNSVSAFSNAGTALSPATVGYGSTVLNAPQSVAVDGAGSLWVANSNAASVTQFLGIATPVVTPTSYAANHGNLATRP